MSNVRERLSGAKYRKLSKEKLEREKQVLLKVPKLEYYFSPNIDTLQLKDLNTNEDNFVTFTKHPPSNGNKHLLLYDVILTTLKA